MNLVQVLAEADISSVLNNGLTISEKAFQSIQMFLMGMGTVFAVLFIIWLVLTIFRIFMFTLPEKRKNAAKKSEQSGIKIKSLETNVMSDASIKSASSGDSEKRDEQFSETNDSAIIAVITAAVSEYMNKDGGKSADLPFRVVSFRRKDSKKTWNS